MAQKTSVDLDRFIAEEYPRVVGAVGLITGNRQDAADAVQDAIVGYLAREQAREITNVAAWITVVACNKLRDRYRSGAAEARAVERLGVSPGIFEDQLRGLDVDIAVALNALPQQQRQVCVLHYLLDQSVESIAEGLGVSESAIKTHLLRARRRLASTIRKEDHRG